MKSPLAPALACALLVAACVPPPAPADERAPALADERAPAPAEPPAPAPAREPVPRYSIESGIIRYEVSGPLVGTEVLYFIDYGDREARYETLRSEGAPDGPPSVERVTIIDGTAQHTIDLQTKLGTTADDVYMMFGGHAAVRRRLAGKTLAEGMLEVLGGERIGTESIVGVECELWQLQRGTTRICHVGGVPISKSMAIDERERVTRAIEVELGPQVEVPTAKLEIPKGVVLRRLGEAVASKGP